MLDDNDLIKNVTYLILLIGGGFIMKNTSDSSPNSKKYSIFAMLVLVLTLLVLTLYEFILKG